MHDVFDWFFVEDGEFKDGSVAKAIVFAGVAIAEQLKKLGNADAGTRMGGLEALGAAIKDSNGEIASALAELAEAVREHK
jgi:hypothetical protein